MTFEPGERLHALDAVRAFALILGVFFHATMSFLPGQQLWVVADVERSQAMGGTFFLLHIFRMSLFFFVAGFFARLSLQKRGTRGFIIDRLKRVAVPLVVGWPILFALIIAVAVWASLRATGKIPSPPATPDAPGIFFPLTHLWFLYVLLWLYALALGVRWGVLQLDRSGALQERIDRLVQLIAHSHVAPLVLAAPLLVSLWYASPWYHYFGVPPADMNLIVNAQALTGFGTAFGFGWLVHRQIGVLEVWTHRWRQNLVVAVVLSIACLTLVGPTPIITPAARNATTVIYAVCYVVAIWAWTLAIVGAALHFCSNESPVRRYVADASYWIYLVHVPLVMALQTVVAQWSLPWFIKYAAVLLVAFPIMLVTYQWLVRYTFLGAILNGRRYRAAATAGAVVRPQET
jgi:peptidoglycan/LPS O-acetylase OafA/YrhL